jgi:hypothetical protein
MLQYYNQGPVDNTLTLYHFSTFEEEFIHETQYTSLYTGTILPKTVAFTGKTSFVTLQT